jgi:hypothetical protein|tara:strand:- start:195 stop:338 length:144 start_codon:yes stop_codon:yes gene_type:complete
MSKVIKKPKENIIKKLIDFLIKLFSIKSKKEKEKEKTSKTDDIYPMW